MSLKMCEKKKIKNTPARIKGRARKKVARPKKNFVARPVFFPQKIVARPVLQKIAKKI